MFCVISTRTHPFEDEQFIGVTLTTTDHSLAHPLRPRDWDIGGTPEQSYVLPLSIHTPRASTIRAPTEYEDIMDPWQGTIATGLLEKIIDEIVHTLRLDTF